MTSSENSLVTGPARKQCLVAYATREKQWLWPVDLPADATVAAAVDAARALAGRDDVPWDTADIGIFGQPCKREAVPVHGDRIELYRPLAADPKAQRRARVQAERRGKQRQLPK